MEKFFLYFVVLLLISCKNNKIANLSKIDFEKEISIDVTYFEIERGVCILNNEYILFSACKLIYKDNYPKWITRRNKPVFMSKGARFTPTIRDIRVPYKLYKNAKTQHFFVVKNQDTLKFELIEDY